MQIRHSAWLVAMLFCGGFLSPAAADPATSVPAFARIAGIRVGLDTMQRFERQVGRGKPVLGGHPRGGRMWRTSARQESLYADGFNSFDFHGVSYAGGRQIDTFMVNRADDASGLPRAHLDRRQLKFVGRVSLGTRRAEVLAKLSKVLPPPELVGEKMIWRAKGFVRLRPGEDHVTTDWKAELSFEHDRLIDIAIFVDG